MLFYAPGSAVGIILPDDADESVYELLEFILDGVTLQLEPELAVGRARREVDFAHSVVRGNFLTTLLLGFDFFYAMLIEESFFKFLNDVLLFLVPIRCSMGQ